ncbi:hypothetical protein [Streptococcus sp. S784/96/1]|uniref:hypothetical protein n=1 Tax=Streptococcus sp. S784/96/1 TaxID=2653499 RepID=UPI0013866CB9|nr:hypothetical protein [Streptococcus sp. S784/96/1]
MSSKSKTVITRKLQHEIFQYGKAVLRANALQTKILDELGELLQKKFPEKNQDELIEALYDNGKLPNGKSTEILAYLANGETEDISGTVEDLVEFLEEILK